MEIDDVSMSSIGQVTAVLMAVTVFIGTLFKTQNNFHTIN